MTKLDKIPHYTESPMYELELTARYCRMFGAQLFQKVCNEIKPEEFAALDTISAHDSLCQRDLARLILKDRANTGRIVNSLEEKGYILRINDTKNNRLVRVLKITNTGCELLSQINNKLLDVHQTISGVLSQEDVEKMRVQLKIVREALSKLIDIQI